MGRWKQFAGIKELYSKFGHHHKAIKSNIIEHLVERNANMILVETGVDTSIIVNSLARWFVGDSITPETGKVGATAKASAARGSTGKGLNQKAHALNELQNYDLGITAVYASEAVCAEQGISRQTKEGKVYSTSGWWYAIKAIENVVNNVVNMKGWQSSIASPHNPVLLYDNSVRRPAEKRGEATYWVLPTEFLQAEIVGSKGSRTVQWKTSFDKKVWTPLHPSTTLTERMIRDGMIPDPVTVVGPSFAGKMLMHGSSSLSLESNIDQLEADLMAMEQSR